MILDSTGKAVAQALHGTAIGDGLGSPRLFQPLDALVKPLAVVNQRLHVLRQVGDDFAIAVGKIRDQAAMAAQLQLRKLACEVGAMIEQPGEAVHHACRRAQRFTAYLHAPEILVIGDDLVGLLAQPFEPCAHLIGKTERLGMESVYDTRIEARQQRHEMRIARPSLFRQHDIEPNLSRFVNVS